MKASDYQKLFLNEMIEFNEYRPSNDCWVSAKSIISKLEIEDPKFTRSVIQSLIEKGFILSRPGEKLSKNEFELLIQISEKGIDKLESEKPKETKWIDTFGGKVAVTVAAGTILLIFGYIAKIYIFPETKNGKQSSVESIIKKERNIELESPRNLTPNKSN